MTNTPRLGIVGLGAQGSVYAELVSDGLVPNMDLGAICDGNPATRQLVESEYPAAAFYDDYLTMLESGSVDAVVICVPSYLHPQMGIDALQHGIHVLLEKPAGVYTKQVEELNAVAATKPELTFAIMFTSATTRCTAGSRRSSAAVELARSVTRAGSLRRGGARRPTTTKAPGGLRGAAKAAGCLLTRLRISWIYGYGFVDCHSRCTPRSRTVSAAP